ncbi:MAG: EcsC family protein [Lachnospiraceae bacterium]|nr:EcsC family protein [Lachnospiraceae bacterium]MDD3616779.1 EcsC family protein [Lachnospiraceae bacterium]
MSFVQRKNPREIQIRKLDKQEERFLKKREDKRETALNQFLSEKVPEKLQNTLNEAFAKAFLIIFEKGTGVIEKTYSRQKHEDDYQINQYAANLKGDKKTLRTFTKKAGNIGMKNIVLSGVSGMGMGVFGVGLPDIPIFTGMLLKNIYEIALSYGFEYESEQERYFILLIIKGAVSYGDEMGMINKKVNEFIYNGKSPEDYSQEEMVRQTAGCLSKELLYIKFLQGIPVVGVVGGAYDVVYMNRVTEYAKLKYGQRFLYYTYVPKS